MLITLCMKPTRKVSNHLEEHSGTVSVLIRNSTIGGQNRKSSIDVEVFIKDKQHARLTLFFHLMLMNWAFSQIQKILRNES